MIRFGVVGNYHFHAVQEDRTRGWASAWAGEVLNVSSEDDMPARPSRPRPSTASSWARSLGVEYRPGANFGLGPYVEGSGGHYFDPAAGSAIHGWFTIGIRV